MRKHVLAAMFDVEPNESNLLTLPFRSICLCKLSEIGNNSVGFQEYPYGMKVNFTKLVSAFSICIVVGSFKLMTKFRNHFGDEEFRFSLTFPRSFWYSFMTLVFCVRPPIDDKFRPHIVHPAQ